MIEKYGSKNPPMHMFTTPKDNYDVILSEVTQRAHKKYQQAVLNITRHQFHHDKSNIPVVTSIDTKETVTHKKDISLSDLIAKLNKAASLYQTCVKTENNDQRQQQAAAAA